MDKGRDLTVAPFSFAAARDCRASRLVRAERQRVHEHRALDAAVGAGHEHRARGDLAAHHAQCDRSETRGQDRAAHVADQLALGVEELRRRWQRGPGASLEILLEGQVRSGVPKLSVHATAMRRKADK